MRLTCGLQFHFNHQVVLLYRGEDASHLPVAQSATIKQQPMSVFSDFVHLLITSTVASSSYFTFCVFDSQAS